jgi:hypothetical protein
MHDMKQDPLPNGESLNSHDKNSLTPESSSSKINRRKFVEVVASGALAFTIVPRHVLGGKNFIAPSDKVTLAYIGVGTEGIREMLPLLAVEGFQVVAVCDPNAEAR